MNIDNYIASPFDIEKIIGDICNKRIHELLNVIHTNYPLLFKTDDIEKEYDLIMQNIHIDKFDSTNLEDIASSEKIEKNDKNEKDEKNGTDEKKKNNAIIIIPLPDDDVRCCARVWDNIYDKTGKIVSNIDAIFCCDNFNDIDIKAFNEKYIIGSRCKRKQNKSLELLNNIPSVYCTQHLKHLPHGNYNTPPTKELCHHYLKDCGYI